MKQKDMVVIIIAVFISGILSLFISSKLFAVPKDQQAEVEVVEPITAEFTQPDPRYFNENSINPTQPITIGDGNNSQPFSDTQN